ncbi:MAG: hypothetical protein KAI84_01620 [Gammaproteobacteria bacterium]|nr:hypothetical protein [Gammaproteobacteria bacterium]
MENIYHNINILNDRSSKNYLLKLLLTASIVLVFLEVGAAASTTMEASYSSTIVNNTPVDTDVAPPIFPMCLYGTVWLNGETAPDGTTIQAQIDGEVRGSTVVKAGKYGEPAWNRLIINGDVNDQGRTIQFYVGSISADEIIPWHSGDVEQVDLYFNSTTILIDRRIENGIYYFYGAQLPSGEFPSFISYYPEMNPRVNTSVVFDTTFIVYTLNLIDNENSEEMVDEMKSKAVAFLLDNKLSHGVWRHFTGNIQTEIIPDTDNTAMVFATLVENGVNIDDESLDYMLSYRTPDGIFYTWINSEEWLAPSNPYYEIFKRNDIDANLNADVLYAYSLRNRTQSGIIRYLNNIAENKSFLNGTLYYPSPYVFTYFVTKNYADGGVSELEPSLDHIREYLLTTQKPDGSWGNDLDTALATVSLLNMGYEGPHLNKAIKHILSTQRKDGSWNIYAFYINPVHNIYFGSQELTTSFSLEALIKYRQMIETDNTKIR